MARENELSYDELLKKAGTSGKKTLHDRYVAALEKDGAKIVPSKSRKYTTLTRHTDSFYFVGKSGAIRVGRTSTGSLPVSDAVKAKLLEG